MAREASKRNRPSMTTKPRSPRTAHGPPVDIRVVDALAMLSFRIHEVIEEVAAELELSLVQLRLLGILRDREPGMLELAALLRLDKSSVTGLVMRAERRGFVQRSGREADRRAVHVSLTPTGRALTTAIEKAVIRELTTLVADLNETEREQLASLALRVAGKPSVG